MPANPHADRVAPGAARPNSLWRWWLAIALCSLALYAATANRGPQWQDSGQHILRVVTRQSVNPLGLALSHPLHHWLGRLAVTPAVLEPCLAVTLISAMAGGIAVANVWGCVWTLTRSWRAALLAAGSLALGHTFWQMATRAETYTLVAALLAGECWCIAAFATTRRKGYLWGALLLNGLGLANHNLALLTIPVLGVVLLHSVRVRQIRAGDVAVAVGLWLIGSLPYTGLVLIEMVRSGDAFGTVRSALFGLRYADEVLNTSLSPGLILRSLGFVVFNFPGLLLSAAVYGVARAGRLSVPPVARWALFAGLVIHAAFALRYTIKDQFTFFLPTYVLLCIFGGVGFAAVPRYWSQSARKVTLLAATVFLALTPVTYAIAVAIARETDALGTLARNKPYRDDYVYALIPWSVVERSAEQMSRHAVELAGPGGVIIVEDAMADFAVRYQALRSSDEPPQVIAELTEAAERAVAESRTVVLVPMDRDAPRTDPPAGLWHRVGDLYVLRPAAHPPEGTQPEQRIAPGHPQEAPRQSGRD